MILLNLIYFSYSEHLKGSFKNIMIFPAILPVNFDSASLIWFLTLFFYHM